MRLMIAALTTACLMARQVALGDSEGSSRAPIMPHTILGNSQPGYYRLKVGDVNVIALSDGTLAFPADDLLLNAKPGEVHRLLQQAFDPEPLASVNAYLVFVAGKVILIDTGAETLLGPTLGKLPESLKAAGVKPSQITDIYLTHIHPDHAGGLMVGKHKVFTNAVVHVDRRDLEYWINQPVPSDVSELIRPFFGQARAKVGPYLRDGHVRTFDGTTQFLPGFSSMAAYGHTPGHSCYVLESAGQKMVFMGDTTHVLNIQFTDPGIAVKFDSNPARAVEQRRREFADAAQQGYLLAFTHVSFPGVGHLQADGDHYRWIPLPFVDDAVRP
jgi:glyoxylase-like metal-dependent hydrolase (beta-lactamase superfamily II)